MYKYFRFKFECLYIADLYKPLILTGMKRVTPTQFIN